MTTYFISDLHLRGEQPQLLRLFEHFVDHIATDATSVYILGDLFEVWLGDDMVLPDYQPALAAIRRLTRRGIQVSVMYGNRDFLMREEFCRQTGAMLLGEPAVITLDGTPTLLLHGDSLCTDDVRYQQFRSMVRNPQFQQQFLSKPPAERLAIVKEYRQLSKSETSLKSEDIMDVNPAAVIAAMQHHQVTRLIHGHTHRPAIHKLQYDHHTAQRIVLSDWHPDKGNYLACRHTGCTLQYFDVQ